MVMYRACYLGQVRKVFLAMLLLTRQEQRAWKKAKAKDDNPAKAKDDALRRRAARQVYLGEILKVGLVILKVGLVILVVLPTGALLQDMIQIEDQTLMVICTIIICMAINHAGKKDRKE